MDVFSWFRQKRHGIRPVPFDEIAIPLEPTPAFGLVVYCQLESGARPSDAELVRYAEQWTQAHTIEPLRSGILDFLRRDLMNFFVHDRSVMPEPPDDVLRAYNPGETEERRFRNATHALVIGAPDLLIPPRIGLWSVIAAARGIAAALPSATIVDPEFPRLLPLAQLSQDLPEDGVIRVTDHILIPYSSDAATGLLWITTKGMARFGLPDIEIHDAPPNLAGSLMPVMNGLAQRLAQAATRLVLDNDPDEDTIDTLSLRSQFRFGVSDVQAAYEDPSTGTYGGSGDDNTTTIRLELRERGDGTLYIRLAPPHGLRADIGVWLNRMLSELMGSDLHIEAVESGDKAMTRAHETALAELPGVRSRFQVGFRSGEVLHIKHGFETADKGHEFMWVAVTHWDGDMLRGNIANDPQYRRDLQAGQTVTIREGDVFDWMIAHTDGRVEGAFTNDALQDYDDHPEDEGEGGA